MEQARQGLLLLPLCDIFEDKKLAVGAVVHAQVALRQVVDPVRGGDGAGSALNGLSERDLAI